MGASWLTSYGERTRPPTHPHTTHERSSRRIEYRHHPFYGSEVKVVRVLRHFQESIDLVQLPAGSYLAVPHWMFDPLTCHSMPQEASPRVALAALLRLSALLERHRLRPSAGCSKSGSSPLTKGIHVPRQERSILSIHTGLWPQGQAVVGTVACSPASALSSTLDSIIGQRGSGQAATEEPQP